ncbi:MAG: CRISPR-associated endonuclease Cas1 [Elusimicrobiales bacterium]|jgi:CRISPR-associated protein Cas1|nr:CRISPR-associated endonuclease Cas1 [Elusimicrobiales bacterium]
MEIENPNNISDFPVQENLFEEGKSEVLINFNNIPNNEQVKWRISPQTFLVKSDSGYELLVAGYNVKLSKKSERIVIKDNDRISYEIPFFRLSHINIQSRGVSLSSDVIEECSKKGIIISFMSFNGKPYACLSSPYLNATIKTRREQIASYSDKRGVIFSKNIVSGKMMNQSKMIKYFIKNYKNKNPSLFDSLNSISDEISNNISKVQSIDGNNCDEVRPKLLSVEGYAGKIYWEAFKNIISDDEMFRSREHRGSITPVNSLLNYGYGMLYSIIWGAVLNAGLEPFAGFLHVDESGRPSMVLDMVEEFRSCVVERSVMSFVNLGTEIKIDNGLLSLSTRKEFSEKVLERLESYEPYNGKNYRMKSIIQLQSRRAASFFRDGDEYKSFSFKW